MALVLITAAVAPGFINVPFPAMRIAEAETRLTALNATVAILGVKAAGLLEKAKGAGPAPSPPVIHSSCLAYKIADPKLSGYQIKTLKLSDHSIDALCDFSTHGGGWTRVTVWTTEAYAAGKRFNSRESYRVPDDGVDDGWIGVPYTYTGPQNANQKTYLDSGKLGYKYTDADINELTTSVYWIRGIGRINKEYYFDGSDGKCEVYDASKKSTGYCSDPHETIAVSSDGITNTLGTRRDCADHDSHVGLSGWSGQCNGCNHFPHGNGNVYLAVKYNSCGGQDAADGYCVISKAGNDCRIEMWVK